VAVRRGRRYPQIWLSTVDRNAVWEAVSGYLDGPGKAPPPSPRSAAAASAGVPEPPGAAPVPPGHVRLYHYSDADADTLRTEGLRIDRAKGERYGEPNRIWASARLPEAALQGRPVVEFAVPYDDPRWDIGRIDAWRDPEEHVQGLHDRGSHVTFTGDIRPEEFVAVHEPWHSHYRYMRDNRLDPADYGWLEDARDRFPDEWRGMDAWRRELMASPPVAP
jgi:hypothetical protein